LAVLVVGAKGGGAALLFWLLVTAGALCWSFSGERHRVHGPVTKDKLWVELTGASETFAMAINGALRPVEPGATLPASSHGSVASVMPEPVPAAAPLPPALQGSYAPAATILPSL
jgi:hypothetical protein